MKILIRYFYAFTLVGAIMLSSSGCNQTDDGQFVEPITIYEKIKGDWKVTSVKQIDEIAKANSQNPSEMILTNQLSFSTFTIKLNVDPSNQPTSYEVGGTAPAMFAKSGYWNLDYPFPSTDGKARVINLYTDASKATKVGELSITATPGAVQVLEFKFTRKTKGIPFVSYVYKLSPNE